VDNETETSAVGIVSNHEFQSAPKEEGIDTRRGVWLGDEAFEYPPLPLERLNSLEIPFSGQLLGGEVSINQVSADRGGLEALMWMNGIGGLADWNRVASFAPTTVAEVGGDDLQQLAIFLHLKHSSFSESEEAVTSIELSAERNSAAHEDRHFCDIQIGFSEEELCDDIVFLAQEKRARAVGWLVEDEPVSAMLWDMATLKEYLPMGYNVALANRKGQPDVSKASFFSFAGGLAAVREVIIGTLLKDLEDSQHEGLRERLVAVLEARRLKLTRAQLKPIPEVDITKFHNLLVEKTGGVEITRDLIENIATLTDEQVKNATIKDVIA
jgi:hypothetical protein